MEKIFYLAAASLLSIALSTHALAEDSADTDVFMKCLAIAQDQINRDPDPKMKEHWEGFKGTYLASAYHYAKSVDYVRDNLGTEMEKFENMRQILGSQKVDGLSLALLNRCDKDVIDNLDRWPEFEKAMNEWMMKHPK